MAKCQWANRQRPEHDAVSSFTVDITDPKTPVIKRVERVNEDDYQPPTPGSRRITPRSLAWGLVDDFQAAAFAVASRTASTMCGFT
jgi:hypothetical protein